ncbi:MAG: C25 family cysteine peptidase [Thermoanaerobaculia bacterium]
MAALVEEPVHLEAGAILDLRPSWPTGDTWAGQYRLAAELTGLDGSSLALSAASFDILEELEVEATIRSGQPLYQVGDPVEVVATVTYTAGNALLDGSTLETQVVSPQGFVVESRSTALGSMFPGDTATVETWWDSEDASAGSYSLHAALSRDGTEIATAVGTFELEAPATQITGTLALSNPAPPIGESVVASWTALLAGPDPLLAVPLRVRVLEPVSGVTLQIAESIVDLQPGMPVSASVPVTTTELETIPYVVLLQAEVDDEAGVPIDVTLAVETLWPVDGEPPVVEILRPTTDQLLGLSSLSAALSVLDPSDPIATVECRIDGGAWFAAQPVPPGAATHSCDLSELGEGAHSISARASDETGNTTTEGPVPFEVDRTPPDIQVLGVSDGVVYTDPVTPEIVVVEVHPGQQDVLLDGLPFASGTTVEDPGDHLLEVVAEDAAGNVSEASVHFILVPDGQSLELVVNTVNDVDDGHCDAEHCSLREAIRVANQDDSPDTILFAIPGVGIERVLRIREPLPAITSPVTLDGLSQAGATCDGEPAPVIVLDGAGLDAADDGIVLQTTDVVLRGLSVVRFPGHGVRLTGGGRHTLDCSRIGALDDTTEETGNGGNGLLFEGGSADNRIGSTGCPGPCNVIAFNAQAGVALAPSAGGGNEIRGNEIFRNGGLGIDLGDDGLTLNDPLDGDEGPNRLQNYPVVTAVRPGETSEVDILVQATPEHDFGIDLFRVDSINGDRDGVRVPPPFGEADHLLALSTASTDASGEGTVTVSVPADLSTSAVTATVTDLGSGDTSELSSAVVAHFTHSLIAGLRAVSNGRGAGEVGWRTSSEGGVLGFRLFRRHPGAGGGELEWDEVTREPILALQESPEGALYSVPVEGVAPGDRMELLLIEEGTRGNRRVYGPFATTVTEDPSWNTPAESHGERRHPASRPTRKPPVELAAPAPPDGISRVAKIGVLEEGLYRVEADEIAAVVELDGAEVRLRLATHQARVEAGGRAVGWLAEEDGSALYFFGEPADDPYSPANVYWLDLESTSKVEEVSGLAPSPVPGGWFPSRAHTEENGFATTNLALDPDEDFWFWTVLVAGAAERILPFDVTDPAPPGAGASRLELDLYAPPAPGASEAHQVSVRINDLPVGSSTWSGWGWQHLDFVFPDSVLQDGENQLTLSSDLPQGATLSFSYVDGFSVTYPRRLEAAGGALLVTEPVNEVVTVEGLTSDTPWVVEASADGSLARVVDLTIAGRGPWSASWVPRHSANRFWAGDPSTAALSPAWIIPDAPSRWQDGRNSADLLVVSTPPLLAALEPLLARRESEGLLVARVDIQDVYDETNGGLASPRALQEFLRRVAERWALPPRYVLLGGAGNFDYKDHLGSGGNLLPPLLARTDDGLFSTDMELGDVTGDGIPDLVVGRIPARTPEEMTAYVDKVLLSETAAGSWAGERLLVADARDGTADFGADSQALAGTVPGPPPTLLLRDALPLSELRDELIARLQSGIGLLHYLGHGGIGQLGVQAILSTADVPTLTNAPYLPVVLAPTCVANRYELPTTMSLGEALVLQPGGGASAVLSASGLSQHGAALRLSQRWLERPWPVPGERLGDRVLSTLREAGGLRTYTLLGDPTLHLPPGQELDLEYGSMPPVWPPPRRPSPSTPKRSAPSSGPPSG